MGEQNSAALQSQAILNLSKCTEDQDDPPSLKSDKCQPRADVPNAISGLRIDYKLMESMGLDNTKTMLDEFFGKHPSLCRNNVVHKVSDFFSDDEDCEDQGGKGKKSSKRKRSQFQEASPPQLRHKRFL